MRPLLKCLHMWVSRFTGEETEAQGGQVTCRKPLLRLVEDLGLELRSP